MLNDFRIAPLSGGEPSSIVLFLHGYGDRGDGGLLEIGRMWQSAMPECEFVCPDAYAPFEMNGTDFSGRQWFSLRRLSPEDMLSGVLEAAPALNAYIDQLLTSRKLSSRQLAIVGFSQGTMMALYVAPRRSEPVACVVGYSGMLVAPEKLISEKKSSSPILLCHGTADDVVPFASMAAAEQGLRAAHLPVRTSASRGTGHTIDDAGLTLGGQFILENLRSATM